MLARLHELRDARLSFSFESTLAGRGHARYLRDLGERGYNVELFFVWLRSPHLARQRVAHRVSRGGHHIPPEDITRRYWRAAKNLFDLYIPVADAWTICHNSDSEPLWVARGGRH